MRERLAVMSAALLVAATVSCSQEPETYADCLRSFAGDSTPEAARTVCRDAFPPDTPFYQGTWHYATEGSSQCSELAFDSAGNFLDFISGICGDGSRIECTDEECFFTCRDYANRDSTAIWLVAESSGPSGRRMPGTMLQITRRRPQGGFQGNRVDSAMWMRTRHVSTFYSSVAACEQRLKDHRREEAASDTASEG